MLDLNDLFAKADIDPSTLLVMRHRPSEPELRRVFTWLAAEKPNVYNAYQRVQGPRAEKAMLKAKYLVI